jgi:hypothetical protein
LGSDVLETESPRTCYVDGNGVDFAKLKILGHKTIEMIPNAIQLDQGQKQVHEV